jgi:ribonuclease PH
MMRNDQRAADALRQVTVEKGFQPQAYASLLITMGGTQVSCAVTLETSVPPFLKGTGQGWLTAEDGMLPCSTSSRMQREAAKGRSGRTFEIQRLIGRSLRTMLDLGALGEVTLRVDCDVLKADGGTRTASITGGYVALAAALITYGMERHLVSKIAAVSVGIVDGVPLLDLDYSEDSKAQVDLNVVGTDAGTYVELQGTAEGRPFDREAMDRLLDLANAGLGQLFAAQADALSGVRR